MGTMFFRFGYLSRHVVITSHFDLQTLVRHLQSHFGEGQMGSSELFFCNKAGCVDNSFATKQVGTMFFRFGYLSRHVVITSPFDLQNLVTHLQRHFGKGQMGSDKA